MTKLIEAIIQVWYRDTHIKKNCQTMRINAKPSEGSVKKQMRPYQLLKLKFCEVYYVLIKVYSIEYISLL